LHDRCINNCKDFGDQPAKPGKFSVTCFVQESLGLLTHMAAWRSSSSVLVPAVVNGIEA
jgi:hypothetical protein